MQQQHCRQLVYINRELAEAEHTSSSAFIRLLSMGYKRQDRTTVIQLEFIQLCVKAPREAQLKSP